MISVFLGGTCHHSTWRDDLIAKLDPTKIKPFNSFNWAASFQ